MARQFVVALLVLTAIYTLSPNRAAVGSDSFLVVPTAHSLLYEGNLDLAEYADESWYGVHYAQTTLNGRVVDYFPWLTAALTVPAVAVWDLAASVTGGPHSGDLIAAADTTPIQALYAALLAALAAAVLGLVTRELLALVPAADDGSVTEPRLPARLRPWAVTVWSLMIGLGTSLWSTASRALWQHGPSILLGALALLVLLRILRSDERLHLQLLAAGCGALLALAYWERPVNLVLTLVALTSLVLLRREALPPLLAGSAAVHAVMVALTLFWLGRPLPPYFSGSRIGVHPQLLDAAAANLISPARGLFVFSPFLLGAGLLLVPSRLRSLGRPLSLQVLVSLAGTLAYLLAVSAYGEKWWAGHSYGPRFMSEALILLAPLALLGLFGPAAAMNRSRGGTARSGRIRPLFGAVALLLSVTIHCAGATIGGIQCWNTLPVDVDEAPSRIWSLEDPQVTSGFQLIRSSGWRGATTLECSS